MPEAFIAVSSTSHLRMHYEPSPKGERFFNNSRPLKLPPHAVAVVGLRPSSFAPRQSSSGKPFGTALGLASVVDLDGLSAEQLVGEPKVGHPSTGSG